MVNISGFKPDDYDPRGVFTPLPAGQYLAHAVKNEFKDTKDGKGKYLQFDFVVLKGDFKGRFLTDRLNLKNANPDAVEMANRTLADIMRAANKKQAQDTDELNNCPMILTVSVEPREDKPGSYSNDIDLYEAVGSSAPAAPAASPAAPASTVVDESVPIWQR